MLNALSRFTSHGKEHGAASNTIECFEFYIETGRRLTLVREWLGYNPKEFAKVINVSARDLKDWENGNTIIPPEHATNVADVCSITTDYLYRGLELGLPRDFSAFIVEKCVIF